MDKILPAALAAKHTHHPTRHLRRRTVAIIVKRGQQVLVEKIAEHLRAEGKSVRGVVVS